MNRTAGTLVLLALLGGCKSVQQGPEADCPCNHFDSSVPVTSSTVQTSQAPVPHTASWAKAGKPDACPAGAELFARTYPQNTSTQCSFVQNVPSSTTPQGPNSGILTASYSPGGPGDRGSSGTLAIVERRNADLIPVAQDGGGRRDGVISLPPSGETGKFSYAPTEPPAPRPSVCQVRFCKNKRLVIHYDIKDVGPAGVGAVTLWHTRDAATWHRIDLPVQQRSPCVVEVNGEGLYGFTVVAQGGDGQTKPAPAAGEQPQFWTEVDMTKPVVRLTAAEAMGGPNVQKVLIAWTAADRNLGPRPIDLLYAEREDGPWQPIARNLENSGHYEWVMSHPLPHAFYVRAEAVDLAGNVGTDQTPRAISALPHQPNASITSVDPDEHPSPLLVRETAVDSHATLEGPRPGSDVPAANNAVSGVGNWRRPPSANGG